MHQTSKQTDYPIPIYTPPPPYRGYKYRPNASTSPRPPTEVLTQLFFNDGVVCERDALPVDLAVAALVDQLTHSLQVGHSAMQQGIVNPATNRMEWEG